MHTHTHTYFNFLLGWESKVFKIGLFKNKWKYARNRFQFNMQQYWKIGNPIWKGIAP